MPAGMRGRILFFDSLGVFSEVSFLFSLVVKVVGFLDGKANDPFRA